jgi:hypothetical protein
MSLVFFKKKLFLIPYMVPRRLIFHPDFLAHGVVDSSIQVRAF